MAHAADPDWDLLATYLSGEATAEEARTVEEWIGDDSERAALVEESKRLWDVPKRTFDSSMDLETAMRGIEARLDAPGIHTTRPGMAHEAVYPPRGRQGIRGRELNVPLNVSAKSSSTFLRRMMYGSPIAMLIGAVVWFGLFVNPTTRHSAQYATAPGQSLTVTLDDGSRVILAPASHLRVESRRAHAVVGSITERLIELDGEALFTVRASSQAPLTVRTTHSFTQVLGTTFAVRTAPDGAVDVHVLEGRVRTGSARSSVVVGAGANAHVTDSTAVVVTQHAPTEYTDWAHGQLVFNGASVPEVLATIGKWYGYQFRLTDSVLAKRTVSVSFKIADSTEMMILLRGLLDVDLRVDGKTVILLPRTAPRATHDRHTWPQQFTPATEMGK